MLGFAIGIFLRGGSTSASSGGAVDPANSLALGGNVLKLGAQTLTLGA
jgi:hypothetical protein